jgi:cytochrome c biogenesis protein CcmG/thiol:disulfide interchange protein DsbE
LKAWSSRTVRIALVAVGILLAAALAVNFMISRPTPTVRAEIGAELPDAGRKMQTLDGGEVTFSQFEGHTVIVNFWASWCRPCIREFPLFVDALESREGLRILGVIYDDSAAAARDFAKRLGASWPSVVDSDDRTARMFGVSTPPGIPQTFFIDKDGVLRSRIFGEIDRERLDDELSRTDLGAS